ncbi:MAG TPA: dicarboxylate/amino acid:cation symporter [Gemmatimonadaceae bacterium]
MSLTTKVLIGLLGGLAAGLAISMSGSPALLGAARWVEPVGTLFINAIRMTVIPLVVGSLVAGIASASEPRALGRLGISAVVLFAGTLALGGFVTALVAPPMFDLIRIDPAASEALRTTAAGSAATAAEQVSAVPGAAEWIIGLVPANPMRAAADGAMLPLIVFAVVFGLAVASLRGEARQTVARLFEAIRDASLVLVRWVLAAAPIGVFALALPLAARLGLTAAGALAGYILIVAVLTIVLGALVLYPMATSLGGVSLAAFARAALPAQAVAFSSRSSLASLPAAIESARTRLHLPEEMSGFFLPLAASVYRFGAAVGQTAAVLFLAQLYGVDLSAAQLASAVVTVVITSFSVPGVPGGSIVIMAPVLMSAGLPLEGIGILLGVDTIPDMFRTMANVTGHLASATALGGRRAVAAGGIVAEPAGD